MADLNENQPDPPEALDTSTEDHMNNDTEHNIETTESDSPTAGALEHEPETNEANGNANDQQNDENEPQETNEIIDEPTVDEPTVDETTVDEPTVDESIVEEPIVEEPPPIDESVIGHVTISKECEDFSKKLFSSSSKPSNKPTTGRTSRRHSLAYERVKESFKRDRLDSLVNRFDSFVGKTAQKIEKLDTKIASMEKPITEE